MAPHGKTKLKRSREPDLSKAAEHTNEAGNQLSPSSPDTSRVKTPTHDRSATPVCPDPAREKSPPKDENGSPDTDCSICLGELRNKSFTDSCLHQFCFKCLVQWSKVKPECPLCKQGFKSIIHNVRSNEDYDQYHCRPAHTPATELFLDELLGLGPGVARFRYRTTHVSSHRRMAPFNEATFHDLFLQHQNMTYVIPPAAQNWISRTTRRQLVSSEFRAGIYNRDLWVQDLPDITGRYRDCSPEFYRVNQAQLHRLVPWLNREIPIVAPNNSTHAQVIIDLILSLVTQHHIQSRIMYGRLRPYFGVRTSHFLHELHAFARSPFDLIGHDQSATYGPNPNPTVFTPDVEESRELSDSDSDVIVLNDDDVGPIAGPSGLRRRTDRSILPVRFGNQSTSTSSHSAPLSVDDSDDCEIVSYIKPRHERTPEIIVLSDSDEPATGSAPVMNQDPNSNGVWNRMLDNVHDSLDIDISSLFSPQSPSPPLAPHRDTSLSSSTSEYIPYTLRSVSKNNAAKKSRKKGRKTTRKQSGKSCGKATKMKARSDFSDSDDEEKFTRSSKSRRNTKPSKGRNQRRSVRVLPKSPSSSVSYNDLPGTSGFGPNGFSSDDSLNDHSSVVIPFLEEHAHANSNNEERASSSSEASTRRMWSVHSSPKRMDYHSPDQEYKPNINSYSSPDSPGAASPNSRAASPSSSTPFTQVETAFSKPCITWCIKPSPPTHVEGTDTNDTSPSSSGSEYHPRLKSIVIMRANNADYHMHTRHGPRSPDTEPLRGRSKSPIASTSRTHLQSSVASTSARSRSRSPGRHSLHTSALSSARGKVFSYKCKSKSSKKECKRRSRNRSDSDSNWERSKKRRISKWQFNETSDDSSS